MSQKRREPKQRIGYRIYRVESSVRGYRHLHLEIMPGDWLDAAEKYAQSGGDYELRILTELRNKTGQTHYLYTGCRERGFELRWQTHYEGGSWHPTWYAMRVESSRFNEATVALMQRLIRQTVKDGLNYLPDATPQQIITAIKNMGGLAVNYGGQDAPDLSVGYWHPDGEGNVALLDPGYPESQQEAA